MSFAGNISSSQMERGRRVTWRYARNARAHGFYRPTRHPFLGSFAAVLERWQTETAFLSDPEKITQHPSYQALVQNAQVAAPLILNELRKEPSLLVWVLDDAFPGERPYAPNQVGNIAEMTKAWLAWGEQRGRHL